jgi:hypothetical protein
VTFSFGSDNPPYGKGSGSLQFRLDENFSISNYEGALFSYQYGLSESTSIRYGVSFDAFTSKDDEDDNQYIDSDDPHLIDELNRRNEIDFQLWCSYIRFMKPSGEIVLYYGFGPIFSYEHDYRKQTIEDSSWDNDSIYQSPSNTYGLGLHSILGIEWFKHRNISFLFEYGCRIEYIKTLYEQEYSDHYNADDRIVSRDYSRIDFSANEVKLGISFYFKMGDE